MNELTPTISERIKARMASLNLNQSNLSKISCVERSALNRYIKGDRPWRREHLARLAPALGTSLEELIAGTAEEAQFASEESALHQAKEMEDALAEAITRAQERDAQIAAIHTQLEAAQQALARRPTQEAFDEINSKCSDAEERERATAVRMKESQKLLEDETAKRKATEKELESLRATYESAVKLAEKNHKAAEHNKEAAVHWKAQFDNLAEQLKKETDRANRNCKIANTNKALCDQLAAEKQATEMRAQYLEDLANENAELARQNAEFAEQQRRRATEAESSASTAKGLAFLTTTLGAISLLSRSDD